MHEQSLVLVVDDEPDIRELLEITLSRMGLKCMAVADCQAAKNALKMHKFFLCLADMCLPDGEGIELVEHIQTQYHDLPVAIITAYGNVEGAVNALKAGAFDYVSKPINLGILRGLVNTALKLSKISAKDSSSDVLLGQTPVMQQLCQTISKLARSHAPVFISGESGTGKELVARLIHQQGPNADHPFIPVNCGAIPNELMESEFFGHKKGSFSGAIQDKQGLFQAANGGTLFLDEVADLPLAMQVKLLRAIQEKTIRPIGALREISIDVRILSATHKNLQALVQQDIFRQDLFYRINVIEVKVPSLHQRQADLPELVDYILSKHCQQESLTIPKVSAQAMHCLQSYSFPGNIRELENILQRALTLCDNQEITANDLQLSAIEPLPVEEALDSHLDNHERSLIVEALERNKWNRTQTAKELGITFRALHYRLKKLEIE